MHLKRGLLLACVIVGGLLVPAAAQAATGSIAVTGIDPAGGLDVTATINVAQSDCTTYGYCGWFASAGAVPAGQGCTQAYGWVGPVQQTLGPTPENFVLHPLNPGPYTLCLQLLTPTDSTVTLAQSSYTVPAPSATITSHLTSGEISGTISISQPYCEYADACGSSAIATQQVGSGPCTSLPNFQTIWSDSTLAGQGTSSYPYTFTPAASSGSLTLCVYLNDQLVGSSSFTFPAPAPPPPATSRSSHPSPYLGLSTAKTALRRAIGRHFKPVRNLRMRCHRSSATIVRCSATFIRRHTRISGVATARLSGRWIYLSWRSGKSEAPKTQTHSAPAPSQPSVEGPGSYSHATDTQFCTTHVCIANFPNGNGFIVQCADGEWSHSGGIQGACSYHGGEA